MRKILFVVAMALGAVAVQDMRADAGCGGGGMANPCGGKVMPKPPQAAGLTIAFVAPKVGDVQNVKEDESLDGTVTMQGKTMPIKQSMTSTYTRETVTVSGDAETKVKVTFKTAHASANQMGAKSDADLPVKGKVYVVTGDAAKPTVTDAKGAAASEAEAGIVAKAVENIGQADKFGKMMATKSFVKGAKVTLSADEVTAMMGNAEGMTVSDVSLTLTNSDGKTATFTMTGTFGGKQGPMDMKITFTAVAKVDIKRSRPLDLNMTGDVTGSGDLGQQGGKIDMKGKMTVHKSVTYK